MTPELYNFFVLALAGSVGGFGYWMVRNRQRMLARVKSRRARR